ncbi:F-box protein [Aspergillus affinis]|uniref:F-box protein n=1 Tax=Aspergillus affinis TaxID=1070780 RepID=UPI0022FDBCC2|nr:uncharacterized protein KD926_004746 [Aspergillus affinis]KAI9042955.1 hypothetical protein KD926_004746 [Aspergillus affinis]
MTALEENAAFLPMEILDLIFSYVEEIGDIHDWYRLSLVNHSWYSAAIPRLYHTFINNGEFKDRERLWQFMRTVVQVPSLAKYVKAVDLQHCLKYTGIRSVALARRLCDEYLPVLHQGLYESGIDYYEPEETYDALRLDNRRPIVAMILACVTEIESLYMHATYDDKYLRAVAENAVIPTNSAYFSNDGRKKFAFKHLKKLCLNTDDQPYGNVPLQVDRYQPFIYFPQLREMTLLRTYLDPSLFSWQLADEASAMTHLTKLTIDLHKETRLEDLLKFLDKRPPLTSLCVDFSSIPQSEWAFPGPSALWNRLSEFKTTLETLDLYCPNLEPNRPDTPKFCPPVAEFTKLKSLSIGPAFLFGNCRDHDKPYQLMEHIPHGLDFLGLYGDPGSHWRNWVVPRRIWAVPDVEVQLEVLAKGREPKVIHVEGWGGRTLPMLPIKRLRTVCRQKRIEYRTIHLEDMNRGGLGSEFAKSSYRHARPNSPGMDQVML